MQMVVSVTYIVRSAHNCFHCCHGKQLFWLLSGFCSEFVHNRKLYIDVGQFGLLR